MTEQNPDNSIAATDHRTQESTAASYSQTYPFSAIVDQTEMKRALVLNAIERDIGGVLIRGERGTAKSTSVRSLADVLPPIEVVSDCQFGCPPGDPTKMCEKCRTRKAEGETLPTVTRPMRVVDLPLNASEDRVVGTIDLEHAVQEGQRKFEPGLLAEANRNVLYVDEVNLLDDHIVDVLLDAAAMGENVVEREGVSYRHPAEFVLVGTMNPEEGDLRPQLLDRFGLVVDVVGNDDVDQRVEINRRREAFDADPAAFQQQFADEQSTLRERISDSQERLQEVTVSDDIAKLIADLNIQLDIDGHRGDITLRRTARTLAAFEGETEVSAATIRQVAPMALDHRLKRLPFEEEEEDVLAVFDELCEKYDLKAAKPNH